MTKQKKSFLDKITGYQEDKKSDKKQVEIEDNREKDYNNESSIDNNELEKNIKNNQSGENEEWFDDGESNKEEGQLTVDVYQTKDLIVIKSIIGGVAPENVNVSVTGDMITIKGARINPDKVEPDDYYYQECFWGCFSRSIILPCDIKTDGVEATMKNGILTVKLPKMERNSSMKIKVKEEE